MMVEDILKRVKENKLYSEKEMRWTVFPNEIQKESDLYGPFISMTEGIRVAIPEDHVRLQGVWLDRYDPSLASDDDLSDIRPNCLFVPQLNAVQRLDDMIRSLEKEWLNSGPEQNIEEKQLVQYYLEPMFCLLIITLG